MIALVHCVLLITLAVLAQPAAQKPGLSAGAGTKAAVSYTTADELLAALEHVGKDIRTLTADIKYDRTFELQGDQQTRIGALFFRGGQDDGPGRAFAIVFRQLIVGDRLETEEKSYSFDGQWLVEKSPSEKLFVKRQVVPPGETFDPLKIGEGPFPIPIGQSKADILARYDAALVPESDGIQDDAAAFAAMDGGSWQLRLVPTPDHADTDNFREIRLWYGKDGLFPRMARTLNRSGDVSLVQLLNVRTDEPLPSGVIDTATPPASEGWDVQVKEWREPVR